MRWSFEAVLIIPSFILNLLACNNLRLHKLDIIIIPSWKYATKARCWLQQADKLVSPAFSFLKEKCYQQVEILSAI